MNEIVIAKYGEIALKGHNKRSFEEILIRNIKKTLSDLGEFKISRMQSTVYVERIDGVSDSVNLESMVSQLRKVFGLGAVQKCGVLNKDSFETVAEQSVAYLKKTKVLDFYSGQPITL